MDFDIGIACGSCDTFNPMGAAGCSACGHGLSLISASAADTDRPPANSADQFAPDLLQANPLSEEELMDQVRNYVCRECSMAVPSGQKFCGTCGASVPIEVMELQIKYFGAMQMPGKARLVLIRGDAGVEGLSYMLQGTEHVAGRSDGQILFPDDSWLSARHANFVYEKDRLVVRDEGSLNGVYLRVRGEVPLSAGDRFLSGEQVFELQLAPRDTAGPEPDQTYFYSSPRKPSAFRLVQILRGGAHGLVHCARDTSVTIGREDCEINFPLDVYMSGSHCTVSAAGSGSFTLRDNGSRNGTYVRITAPAPLQNGDYVFLGKQLLRVEMTT